MNENKMPKIVLNILTAPDREVIGLTSNAPLDLAFLAILSSGDPDAPRVDIKIVDATEAELKAYYANKPRPSKPSRPGKMDAALRLRAECPQLVTPAQGAELTAMLSILSDKLAETRNGGAQ